MFLSQNSAFRSSYNSNKVSMLVNIYKFWENQKALASKLL
jgi:hypothetical protein